MENQISPAMPSNRPIGTSLLKAFGFGLVLAVPLTVVLFMGASSVISYFRLSYNWGLGGIFVGLAIAIYGFIGNAVIMILATFITLRRSSRPYLHAFIIGLIINLVLIAGLWAVNLYTHRGELDELAVARNNDTTYSTAQKISDCAGVTDINYWRVCINNKITNSAEKATCESQAQKYIAEDPALLQECQKEFAIGIGSVAACENVPLTGAGFTSQRYCIYDVIQKSWEKNNRKTPISVVEGCASITIAEEKQFCYVASLRQLAAGDSPVTLACQNIRPDVWFGERRLSETDIQKVKSLCNIEITAGL